MSDLKEKAHDEAVRAAFENLSALSVHSVVLSAMAIGQGKPLVGKLYIGDEPVATFDAEELFRDITLVVTSSYAPEPVPSTERAGVEGSQVDAGIEGRGEGEHDDSCREVTCHGCKGN